jgi:hypothetical protein
MASIGFPRARAQGTHRKRSETFGQGWVGFNFARALGVPIHLDQRCGHASARQVEGACSLWDSELVLALRSSGTRP